MRVKLLILLATLALASACQLPSIETIESDQTCQEQESVGKTDIFVVTARGVHCRNSVADFGPFRRAAGLHFGRSSIDGPFPQGRSPTLLVKRPAWESALNDRVKNGGAPVIYIHGYNNSEDAAVRRARAIGRLLMNDRPVIAVTWPSYGNATAIGWDEANNEWAREALSQELAWIVSKYPGTTLIAHSMGNRILLDFLVNNPNLLANVSQIVSAAPDVDEDQFMRHMERGASFGPPVTIYTSTRDQALAGSWMAHGMRRAGDLSETAHNHRLLIRYRDLDPSVTIVDLTDAHGDLYGHSNFIQSVVGAADLCRILNKVTPIGRTVLVEKAYFEIGDKTAQSGRCADLAQHATAIDRGTE